MQIQTLVSNKLKLKKFKKTKDYFKFTDKPKIKVHQVNIKTNNIIWVYYYKIK
nr:MAG TPA: hypothetical protein [Caudoviricetes sp.]